MKYKHQLHLHTMIRISLLVMILMTTVLASFADLAPQFLQLKLESEESTFVKGEVSQLKLVFKNTHSQYRQVLLPTGGSDQQKMITLSYYKVEGSFYRLVAEEEMFFEVDSNLNKQADFRSLATNEEIAYPIFIGDSVNYSQHIESKYELPDLPPGEYQLLARYVPWSNIYAESLYNKLDPFGEQTANLKPSKYSLPYEGLISNYLTITIENQRDSRQKTRPESEAICSKSCSLCKAIEREHWNKVKRMIGKQTSSAGLGLLVNSKNNWTQPHRNIAWLFPYPEAIQASLPTYTYRRMVFKSRNGYHYYSASWQLGKVYRLRSRLSFLFYWWPFSGPIKTSNVDYCKLKTFEEA